MNVIKKRSLLFKLIITMFVSIMIFNFSINLSSVYANKNEDKKLSQENHYTKHANEKPKNTQTGTDTSGYNTNANYSVTTTKVYTYEDGCKKVVTNEGLTNESIRWTYYDGSVQTQASSGSSSTEQSDSDIEHSETMQGGKLLTPIVDLVLSLGDAIMSVLQRAILGTDGIISLDISNSIMSVIVGILVAVAIIAIIAISAGTIGAWITGLVSGVKWAAAALSVAKGAITTVVAAGSLIAGVKAYSYTITANKAAYLPDITVIPLFEIGPEEIFEGKLLVFDINFFNPKESRVRFTDGTYISAKDYDEVGETRKVKYYYVQGDTNAESDDIITSKQNTSMELSIVISKWYYTIRNIAIVIMMLVLMYVGIRIMISSIASEKAKYKKMLGDWVISMCLVFVLHYIMVFAVSLNESFVDLVKASVDTNQRAYILDLNGMGSRKDRFIKAIKNNDELVQFLCDANGNQVSADNADNAELFVYPVNLVGKLRLMSQIQNGTAEYVGYAIAYIVLVFYTLFFTFTYLKRVLYLAFLTVIAPLVAMTYSIDKISDGKAQAFNMWLKEYIFNLLIQPVHLLLYMMLISMAVELAETNIIYTLVAIGFMMPAEKLVRSMFGFEKARTPGFLGGATGAALTMNALQSLSKLGGKGSKEKGANGTNEKLEGANNNLTTGRTINDIFSNEENSNNNGITDGNRDNDNPQQIAENNQRGDDQQDGTENDPNNPMNADNELLNDDIYNERLNQINQQEQEADAIDFLNDEDRYEWLDYASIPDSDMTDDGRQQQMNLERRAEALRGQHFNQERENLEAERIRQQQEQERENLEEERRRQEQDRSERILPTAHRMATKKFREAIKPKNIGAAVASTTKAGMKITGAGFGAAIGAAAGITSGDPNKATQYITLGATAGKAMGGTAGGKVENAINTVASSSEFDNSEYEKVRYGDRYKEHRQEVENKKFKKDKEKREYYADRFKPELENLNQRQREEKIDEIMDDVNYYRNWGVTDDSMIVKAMKMDRSNRKANDSVAAAVIASNAKDLKGIEPYQKQFAKQVGKERAENISNKAIKLGGFLNK